MPWVFVLAYCVGLGLQLLLPGQSVDPDTRTALTVAGIVLWLLAAAIGGASLLLFRRRRTTTVPGEVSVALVLEGPYRLSRNPMYVGIVLAYLGEMFCLGQIMPLIPLVLAIGYLHWAVVPLEESRLNATFGEAYARYRGRVRRWI